MIQKTSRDQQMKNSTPEFQKYEAEAEKPYSKKNEFYEFQRQRSCRVGITLRKTINRRRPADA